MQDEFKKIKINIIKTFYKNNIFLFQDSIRENPVAFNEILKEYIHLHSQINT